MKRFRANTRDDEIENSQTNLTAEVGYKILIESTRLMFERGKQDVSEAAKQYRIMRF